MKHILTLALLTALCAPLQAQKVTTGPKVSTLPYVNFFEERDFSQFGVYDANHDDYSFWHCGDHATYNTENNGQQPADEWFLSPLMYFEAGREYYYQFDLTSWVWANTSSAQFSIYLGNDTDVSTMTQLLAQTTDVDADYWNMRRQTFSVATSGYYSLGMHMTVTEPGHWFYIDIDNFVVDTAYDAQKAPYIEGFDFFGTLESDSHVGRFQVYVSPHYESGEWFGEYEEVSVNFNNLKTFTARTSEWTEFECEIPGDGLQYFFLTVSSAGNHGPVCRVGQYFFGNDIPQVPDGFQAEVTDAKHIQFSWNQVPDYGRNGYHVNPADVTYTVWHTDMNNQLIEAIGPAVSGTSWTCETDVNAGAQRRERFAIIAHTGAGSSPAERFADVRMGAPYAFPFHEGFADHNYDWNQRFFCLPTPGYDYTPGVSGTWGSIDGDDRRMEMWLGNSDYVYTLDLGLFSLAGATDPVFVFDTHCDYDRLAIQVQATAASGAQYELSSFSINSNNGWVHKEIFLAALAGEAWVHLTFRIETGSYDYFYLDNLNLVDASGQYLFLNLRHPSSNDCYYAGSGIAVRPYIYNMSTTEAGNYTVQVFEDGELRQSCNTANRVIQPGSWTDYDADFYLTSDYSEHDATIRVEVTNLDNGFKHSEERIIHILTPEPNPARDLELSESHQGLNIAWFRPEDDRQSGYQVYVDDQMVGTAGRDATRFLYAEPLSNGEHTVAVIALYGIKKADPLIGSVTTSMGQNTVAPAAVQQARVSKSGRRSRLSFVAPRLNAEGGELAYGTTLSFDVNGSTLTARAGEPVVFYADATSFEVTPYVGSLYGQKVSASLQSDEFQPQSYTLCYWNGPGEFNGETSVTIEQPDQVITHRIPWHDDSTSGYTLFFSLNDASDRQLTTYRYDTYIRPESSSVAAIDEIRYGVDGWGDESVQFGGVTSIDETLHVDMHLSEFPDYWQDNFKIDIQEQNDDYDVLRVWFNEQRYFRFSYGRDGNWINDGRYLDVDNSRLITATDVPLNSVTHLDYNELSSGITVKRIHVKDWGQRSVVYKSNEFIYGQFWNRHYGMIQNRQEGDNWIYYTRQVDFPEGGDSDRGKYYLLMNRYTDRWAENGDPKLYVVNDPLPEQLPVYEQGSLETLFTMLENRDDVHTLHLGGAVNENDLYAIRNYFNDLRVFSLHPDQTTLPDGYFDWSMGCHLQTLHWNTEHIDIDQKYFASPQEMHNLMVYAPEGAEVTYEGNVIQSEHSKLITLYDQWPLNIPQGFMADSISFTRYFDPDMYSSRQGRAGGWVGLYLPFVVQRYYSEQRGELAPFGVATSGQRPFWLAYQTETAAGFELYPFFSANYPLIICMPNDPKQYDSEYNISGNVTFSARDAWVNDTWESCTNGKSYNLFGTYQPVPKSDDVYALNETATASYYAGGAFVSNLREVKPFEVYARSNSAARPAFFAIGEEDEATGIEQILGQSITAAGHSLRCYSQDGELYIVSAAALTDLLPIYSLSGQMIKLVSVEAGTTTVTGLTPGIYIIGGQKVQVYGQR